MPLVAYLLRVEPSSELGSERSQFPCLIFLNIQQLLRTRVPERRVSCILCTLVDRLRRRGPLNKAAAVRERHQLGKCVWALWAAEERRVSNLAMGVWRVGRWYQCPTEGA